MEEPGLFALLLQAANWSTIAVCLVLKLPQGAALLGARSAQGLSLESLLLELGGFLVCLRYMSYYGHPLPTYVEYPVMILQDIILCLLVLHYNGKIIHALPYTIIYVILWNAVVLQEWILDLSMHFSTVISAMSKFTQLRCLWHSRDPGQLSAATWALATYTCAARILTTLMTTTDSTVLIRFITMLALNIWLTATILIYRKSAKKSD